VKQAASIPPERAVPVNWFVAACVLLLFLSPAAARAQETSAPAEPANKQSTITDAKGRKVQVVDFDDASIEGRAKAPDGFVLQSRSSGRFKNIIELRRNFRPQMRGSAYEALVAVPTE
jgi:hypothetical protein